MAKATTMIARNSSGPRAPVHGRTASLWRRLDRGLLGLAALVAIGLMAPAAMAAEPDCRSDGKTPCATVADPTLKAAPEAAAKDAKARTAKTSPAPQAANPEIKKNQIRWYFRNNYGRKIEYVLYAANRNWQWPGGNKVYVLPANRTTYTTLIDCKKGEKVCYGAWQANNRRIFWGVGYNARYNCRDCCFKCKGVKTPTIIFNW